MTSRSYEFENELAANLTDLRTKRPREQQWYASPTLRMMRKKEVSVQGHYIEVDVQFVGDAEGGPIAENTTSSTAHVKSLDRAQFEPVFYAEPASMSWVKEQKCNGSRALFNEWDRRVTLAEMRQEKQLATHLWEGSLADTQNADGDNGLTPIPVALPVDNTTGTFGLDRSAKTWWRHYSNTVSGTTAYTSVGPDEMDLMELTIQETSNRTPSFYVTGKTIFQKMKKLARSGTTNFDPTYSGPYKDKLNDAGIKHISWNGTPVFHDAYMELSGAVGSGFIYAIEDECMYLGVHNKGEVKGPFAQQGNGQHGKVLYHYLGIQTICEEPRACGQIDALT